MVYICIYELCFLYCYCICIIYTCSSLVEEIKNISITFPCGILGQVWYLIVSFPDLCHLSYCQDQNSLNAGQKYCKMHLQEFLSALSYHMALRPLFCLFLSGILKNSK